VHSIDTRERRARLAVRHHLAPDVRAATPVEAATDQVGLHASDPTSVYRWAPIERWIGGPLADLPTGAAQADLVRRWLRAYGPGTGRDIAWWTGLTLGEVRRALAAQDPPAVEVALHDGSVGLTLADDLASTADPGPWVALLPALDATTMGWADRRFFLGEHGPRLFDRNGNAGPTTWADGRIVGGWAQRPDGEVVPILLEDVGAEARAAIEAEAARVTAWLEPTRIIPRFRTPLEQELLAGTARSTRTISG